MKVGLQNPNQAASKSVLERVGDSVVYKVKSHCKTMRRKAFLGYRSCGWLSSRSSGNFVYLVVISQWLTLLG